MFYLKLVSDLAEKLPIANNIFGETSVEKYYSVIRKPILLN